MKKYIYPQLSLKKSHDLGLFRLGGPGLANCLFVAARAYLKSKDLGCEMLRPTWERLSIGQWLRGERDKRFYHGLFRDESLWKKLRKILIIHFSRGVIAEEGLGNFFCDIIARQPEVREWFYNSVAPSVIEGVPSDMTGSLAVHVRLGDFPDKYRMPNAWYVEIIRQVRAAIGHEMDVQVFSDGRDEELAELLTMPGVRRVYYGNALADIVAISRCGLLIAGKYSTFATWGAYLGNVPLVFSKIDHDRVIPNSKHELAMGDECVVPLEFLAGLKNLFKK